MASGAKGGKLVRPDNGTALAKNAAANRAATPRQNRLEIVRGADLSTLADRLQTLFDEGWRLVVLESGMYNGDAAFLAVVER